MKKKVFNLNLYCEKCRTRTWHTIEQSNPTMVFTCGECDKKIDDCIFGGRNSVNRIIWDNYVREKRRNTDETKQ